MTRVWSWGMRASRQTGEARRVAYGRLPSLSRRPILRKFVDRDRAQNPLIPGERVILSTRGIALLLEDEAMIALDVADTLGSLGFEVVTVDNCADATRWLHNHPDPKLVVVDIVLRDGPCDAVAQLILERGIPHVIHCCEASPVPPFHKGVWLPKPSTTPNFVAAVRAAVRTQEVPNAHVRSAPESNVVGNC